MQKNEFFLVSNQIQKPAYTQIVRELQSLDTYITFEDTDETLVFNHEAGTYEPNSTAIIKKRLKTLLGEQFNKRVYEETLFQLKIETYVNREDYEPPENLVLVKNGVLDIYTRKLEPFRPDLYFEKSLNATYDLKEEGIWWKRFLEDLVCPKIRELHKFSGYILLNSPRYKKSLLQNGDTDTGKSTFGAGIRGVIGKKNICGVPIQVLDHRFQKTRLYKKMLNFVGDLRSTAFNHVEVFNQTTGGDILSGEIKTQTKTIEFVWTGKHWFVCNKLPSVSGDADSDAFYNRLCIVTFPKQILKNKIIKNFDEKLGAEKEKSAILNWMLDGLDLLLEEGFEDTDIEAIRDLYKRSSDSVYCFAEDMCVLEPGNNVKRGDAYEAYASYCIKTGLPSVGRNTFYDKIILHVPGVTNNKTKRAYEFKNLKITEEPEEETEEEREGGTIGTFFNISKAKKNNSSKVDIEKIVPQVLPSPLSGKIEAVLRCLESGNAIPSELSSETGIDTGIIRDILGMLEREERVFQQPPGYYNLTGEDSS